MSTQHPEMIGNYSYRLIMASTLWNGAFGQIAIGNREWAWGGIRINYHGSDCDLLVDQMRFRRSPPNSDSLSRTDAWVVFFRFGDDNNDENRLREFIESYPVKPGQLVVFIQPGLGPDRTKWSGVVVESDNVFPLDEIRLIGPKMPVFTRNANHLVSNPNAMRWTRVQGALGQEVFERFQSMKVLLIGAGRLGSLMAENLIRMGILELGILDPDNLEIHNLDATIGSRQRDVDKSKVINLAGHLHRINPDSLLKVRQLEIADQTTIDMARSADLLISCVDNIEARVEVAKLAKLLLKVHLDLGTIIRKPPTSGQDGSESEEDLPLANRDYQRELGADIRLILPGSCIRCISVGPDFVATTPGNFTTEHDEPFSSVPIQNEWQRNGRTGSLLSLNCLAAGCAMQMWFDFLAGEIKGSFWQRLQWRQGMGIDSAAGEVRSIGDCSICGRN